MLALLYARKYNGVGHRGPCKGMLNSHYPFMIKAKFLADKIRFLFTEVWTLRRIKWNFRVDCLTHQSICNHFPITWTLPSIFLLLLLPLGWSFQLETYLVKRVGICHWFQHQYAKPYSEVEMYPGGVVQVVRVLKEGRRDEVAFDFKRTLARRQEHVLGVCFLSFFGLTRKAH